MKVWIAHEQGCGLLGTLPGGVRLEVCAHPAELPSDPADVEFWVPPFTVQRLRSSDLLPRMTGLKVVQLLSAGADAWAPLIPDSVTLCD